MGARGYVIENVRHYASTFLKGVSCENYGKPNGGNENCHVADFGELDWMRTAKKEKGTNYWLYYWPEDEKHYKENGKHRAGVRMYCQACYSYTLSE